METDQSPTEAIVHEYVDACNGDDLERVFAILHSQVELHEAPALPAPVSAVGSAAVKRHLDD